MYTRRSVKSKKVSLFVFACFKYSYLRVVQTVQFHLGVLDSHEIPKINWHLTENLCNISRNICQKFYKCIKQYVQNSKHRDLNIFHIILCLFIV